jgi:hypothetical protein
MAYTFSVNNTPLTGAVAMYQLVSALMSAGWLKKMDSDGTTYSATGVQVTSGASGANGLGNSNAWVRLQAPPVNGGTIVNQTRELTIQRGTTDLVWRIKYSASALFTGGTPGISQTPLSTDEVFMAGGGTNASPTFLSMFLTNNTYVWHIAAGDSNEFYSFVVWGNLFGTAGITNVNAIAIDVLAAGSYPATDVDPAVIYLQTSSAFATIVSSGFTTTNVTNPCVARGWMGATSAVGASTSSNNQNMNISTYGTALGMLQNSNGSDPWTNSDQLLPCLWGCNTTATPKGVKGFSTLFRMGTIYRYNSDMCSTVVGGLSDKIYVNGLWLPWSGVKPIR